MSPAVMIHVAAGALGLLAGAAALSFRKGERWHRAAGTVFFVSMLVMAGFAAVLAVLGAEKVNTLAGVLTFYLVATAWAVVKRREGTIGRFERLGLIVALGVAVAGLTLGWQAAMSPTGLEDGDPSSGQAPGAYFGFAGLAALAAAGDLRMILRRGLFGADRISRHLWRMGTALAIAAASFFLGQADEIPAQLRGTHLIIPPLAAMAAMAFWLVRVRLDARPGRETPA